MWDVITPGDKLLPAHPSTSNTVSQPLDIEEHSYSSCLATAQDDATGIDLTDEVTDVLDALPVCHAPVELQATAVTGSPDKVDPVPRKTHREGGVKERASRSEALQPEILERIKTCSSSQICTSETGASKEEAAAAFGQLFPTGSIWENFYQVKNAANHLAEIYGFTTRAEGASLFCACRKTNNDRKKTHAMGMSAALLASTGKKRRRTKMSDGNCL